MKYLPKVSIVIPAYNAENYLTEAIDSALAQTYKNIEIIVVNDGSADDGATAMVASKYKDQIRYFEKSNGGSSSALNFGIAQMTGEWFSWLSHDDLYLPDKIEKQIEFLNELIENGVENLENHILFAACELINSNGKCIYKNTHKTEKSKSKSIEGMKNNTFLIAEAGGKYTFHGCTCLIHKTVFEKIGAFDEALRLVNDVDMWKRIFMAGYKVHYLPQGIVKGRVHSKQVSAGIQFSYHNPEQDAYWTDLLSWLLNEKIDNEERRLALFVFSKSAYRKTRIVEGKTALKASLNGMTLVQKVAYIVNFEAYVLKNRIRNLLKTVYRKLFIKK